MKNSNNNNNNKIIIILIIISCFFIKTIKPDMFNGFIDLSEKSNGTILYKTNSNDLIIASSFEGELFKIQVSKKSIILKSTLNEGIKLSSNEKSSGFFDEKNNNFYLASTSYNTSIQISIFSSIDLTYLTSIFIYNENIPFNENCLFVDNDSNIFFISTNSIYKLKYDSNNKNNKLKIIQSKPLPGECIIPSSSVFNLDRNLLLLGCTSTYGTLYEINMLDLSITANHIYYYGEGIDTLILGPKNSFSFLEGTQNYAYHLVSFTFKDIETSVYRNRETYFGRPTSASSDNDRFALYIFSHDILLFDLTDITNNPYDIDYLEEVVGLSSVYSSNNNLITISTNSSRIYFYQIPSSPQDSIPIESFFIISPIFIVLIIFIIFSIKLIYSKCFKIKKDNNNDDDDDDDDENILKNEIEKGEEGNNNNIVEIYNGDYKLIK
ncbi:hypothetical protein RB653_007195 [Dictyostelium firmibasis]|uniref:Uncharacterized protein n=1 Tax=Dictyostelium firmibasis TaxID=79012 RepID=A0AAN7TU57_9MYCE